MGVVVVVVVVLTYLFTKLIAVSSEQAYTCVILNCVYF